MTLLSFDDVPQQQPSRKPGDAWPYLLAIVFMAFLGTVAILVLTKLRPNQDNSVLITAVIGFLGTMTGTILTFMKAQETHLSVNSRLDAFMASAKQVGHLEGKEEGRKLAIAERQMVPMEAVIPVILQPQKLARDTNATVHKIDDDATARQAPEPSPPVAPKTKKEKP